MIEVKNIKKIYKKSKKSGFFKTTYEKFEAVKDISMNIEEGKIIGLLGINGAGKTTTIKMLSTLLIPDGGLVTVDGMDLIKDGKKIRSRINMIAGGERMIYWRLTPRENLQYFGRLYGIDKDILNLKIDELLSFVGLSENADQPVETFSKGMKQRLQIARGLINDPKYIFLDEPTLGLDVSIASQIRTLCKNLSKNKGKGILLTSHYMNEIEELCDYVYVINNGENLLEGTPDYIVNELSQYKEKFTIKVKEIDEVLEMELLSFGDKSGSIVKFNNSNKEIEVITKDEISQENLMNCIYKHTEITKFTSENPSLEEAMVKLAEGTK